MKNKHQLDEVHLSRQLKSDEHFQKLFYNAEEELDSDIIECPFCFGVTVFSFNSPNRCSNCRSEIKDADLLNSYQD